MDTIELTKGNIMKSGIKPSSTKKLIKPYKSKLAKDVLERVAELVRLYEEREQSILNN